MRINKRGKFKFEIDKIGHLLLNDSNLEKLRKVFLDRSIIKGKFLGPGDPGDFDIGAWHVLCHLAAGCAVFRKDDKYLWVEISHVPTIDLYTATVSLERKNESVYTFPITSYEGKTILYKSELIGFVEGSSLGQISAKDAVDNEVIFNKWKRQDFNQKITSQKDGGRVWEHWCTVRDITPNAEIGLSVLKAYLSMLSLCGGRLASVIARGRRQYHHPEQLIALYLFGVISKEDTLVDITPKSITSKAEKLFYTAEPDKCLKAVKMLPWDEHNLSYLMFSRRANKWSTLPHVKGDFKKNKIL